MKTISNLALMTKRIISKNFIAINNSFFSFNNHVSSFSPFGRKFNKHLGHLNRSDDLSQYAYNGMTNKSPFKSQNGHFTNDNGLIP